MREKKLFSVLSAVLIAFFCINSVISAQEVDVISGYLRPVYAELAKLIPPGTIIAHGPVQVDISAENILYSETGLNKDKDAEFLRLILSVYTMAFGTAFLQEHTYSTILNLRMGVLPILDELNVKYYSSVTEKSGQILLDKLNADYLVVAKILNVDGKWIILLEEGNGNSVKSDLLDQKAMISLIKRAKNYNEGKSIDSFETPKEDTKNKNEKEPPKYEGLPVDRSDKIIFKIDGIRAPSFIEPLNANTFIAVYPPVRNTANASTYAGFVIFNKDNKILRVDKNSHKDIINGVLINAEREEFYTYSDDGFFIAFSQKTFNELYRYKNIRPVKTLSFTTNGLLITNNGDSASKIFSVETKSEVKKNNNDKVLPKKDVSTDINFNIIDGVISAKGKDGGELLQLALYLDNEYGVIIQEHKNYSGSYMIENHLEIKDFNGNKRSFEKSDLYKRVK